MKKLFFIFLSCIIIGTIIIFAVRDRFSIESIISNIESQTGLDIQLNDDSKYVFYPSINFNNENVTISKKNIELIIKKSKINVSKSYWPTSSINLNLTTSAINYQGIEIRNAFIDASYQNNILTINNFTGNIIEGDVDLNGKIEFNEKQAFNIKGNFNNIALNTLLQKSQIAKWDRVKIKLSSTNLSLSGIINDKNPLLVLKGTIPITGLLYLTTTEEERFGATFLSLLVEKIPSISSISKAVNFIVVNYSNIPISLNGVLQIKDGLILSDEILIQNNSDKSAFSGFYNYIKNEIDGTIHFFEKNDVVVTAQLKGKIENPEILVGGKIFSENEEQPLQDIKKLFDEGINSLVDKLLNIDVNNSRVDQDIKLRIVNNKKTVKSDAL